MKIQSKKIRFILFGLTAFILILNFACSTGVAAESDLYQDAFPLQPYDSRLYLLYMKDQDSLEINLTNTYNGDFDIFLFDERPVDSYVSADGYDSRIYNNAVAYNTTSGNNASISYTSTEGKLYYVQVVLISGDTDTFHLVSTQSLELYFIPFLIPGFSTGIIIAVMFTTFLVIWKLKISKKITINHD